MTEAIFSLVGVVVGALLSGGVAYLMARRTERRKVRAAARRVLTEFRQMDRWLATLQRRAEAHEEMREQRRQASQAEPEAFDPDLSMLEFKQLPAHEGLLAEYLRADDWTAISDAYEAIQDIQHRSVDAGYQPAWGTTASGLLALVKIVHSWSQFLQHAAATMPTAIDCLDRLAETRPQKRLKG
jgi:uncharacterized membrane protein YccC